MTRIRKKPRFELGWAVSFVSDMQEAAFSFDSMRESVTITKALN